MMHFSKTTLPVVITVLTGILVLFGNFLRPFSGIANRLVEWQVIVAGIALGLGAANLVRIHSTNLRLRRGKDWRLSALTLIALLGYSVVGLSLGTKHPIWLWVFDWMYSPTYTTIMSLLGFYVCSAAYRAFRLKDFQTFLFLLAGLIVLAGQVGLGQVMFPGVDKVSAWLMMNPTAASMRGLMIVGGIGVAMVSIRILLGIERHMLGGG
jgi:hypothetical protein